MKDLGEHKAANTSNLQAEFLMTGYRVHHDFFALFFSVHPFNLYSLRLNFDLSF